MAKHKCVTHSAIKLNLLANDPSAWAEVWAGSNPARASYPWPPEGGGFWTDFIIFLRFFTSLAISIIPQVCQTTETK